MSKDFEEFWEFFKVYCGGAFGPKNKAYDEYRKIVKDTDPKILTQAILRCAASTAWLKGQNKFAPAWKHCFRWLRDGIWAQETPLEVHCRNQKQEIAPETPERKKRREDYEKKYPRKWVKEQK